MRDKLSMTLTSQHASRMHDSVHLVNWHPPKLTLVLDRCAMGVLLHMPATKAGLPPSPEEKEIDPDAAI